MVGRDRKASIHEFHRRRDRCVAATFPHPGPGLREDSAGGSLTLDPVPRVGEIPVPRDDPREWRVDPRGMADPRDPSVPVDHEGAGNPGPSRRLHVGGVGLGVFVEGHGVPGLRGPFGSGEEGFDHFTRFPGDADDRQPVFAVPPLEIAQVRHAGLAGAAPGRPELDDRDPSLRERPETGVALEDFGDPQRGGDVAHPQRARRLRRATMRRGGIGGLDPRIRGGVVGSGRIVGVRGNRRLMRPRGEGPVRGRSEGAGGGMAEEHRGDGDDACGMTMHAEVFRGAGPSVSVGSRVTGSRRATPSDSSLRPWLKSRSSPRCRRSLRSSVNVDSNRSVRDRLEQFGGLGVRLRRYGVPRTGISRILLGPG